MTYQEDLRESQVLAIWVGHIESEDALVDYMAKPFENDFGFLLDYDALPEFTYSFESRANPPDLNRKTMRACVVPFDREVEIGKLLSGFSNAGNSIIEAAEACRLKGIKTATIAIAFPNLRYRPELCCNPNAPIRFIGNFSWPAGKLLWDETEKDRLIKSPFPKLIRKYFNDESELSSWDGIVRLNSWKGFATYSEISSMGWEPTKGCLPDGDFNLSVDPASTSSLEPTEEQCEAFRYFIENETTIRDAVLKGIFEVYPAWRENYYGGKESRDGGKTWQTGWELPEIYPPENMPELSTPDDLRRLIRLGTVHVMSKPKDGFTRIGFSFSCKWDEEHGLGVSTHKGNVVEVGQAEESFSDF